MLQIWNIKSRAHECARTAQPFTEGEIFHTAIYFDTEAGELVRRDVSISAWKEEIAERTPIAYWRTEYVKPQAGPAKPEIATRESPESLLRRLIEDDQEHTEHARYILALMLERKRQLVPKEKKYTESGTMLIYEMRRTGEVFIIRDPELRLDEIEAVQEEVAMLLGFGGPNDPPAGAAPAVAPVDAEAPTEPVAEVPTETPQEAEETTTEVEGEAAADSDEAVAGAEAQSADGEPSDETEEVEPEAEEEEPVDAEEAQAEAEVTGEAEQEQELEEEPAEAEDESEPEGEAEEDEKTPPQEATA